MRFSELISPLPADKTLAALAAGVAISQPVLLATWAAFARQRFYHRLLWSLLICTYLSFADDLGTIDHVLPNGRIVADPWLARLDFLRSGELILTNMTLFVVALVVFLPIRRLFRWQITRQDVKDTRAGFASTHLTTIDNIGKLGVLQPT